MLHFAVVTLVGFSQARMTGLEPLAVSQGQGPPVALGLDVEVVLQMGIQYVYLWGFCKKPQRIHIVEGVPKILDSPCIVLRQCFTER